MSHNLKAEERDWVCENCDYRARESWRLRKHVKAVHDQIKDFACSNCHFRASTSVEVKAHFKAVHAKIKDWACDHCHYRSSTKFSMESHVKLKHDKIKNMACSQCNYKTGHKGALKSHIKNNHSEKSKTPDSALTLIRCPKCPFSTRFWSDLSEHVLALHEKLKIFSCDKCNYGTKRSGDFKKHVKAMHDKIKDFRCPLCDFEATFKQSLEQHVQRKHYEGANYPCAQCHHRAVSEDLLRKHVKYVHDKALRCGQCAYRTGRRDCMRRHAVAVHGDYGELTCKECDFVAGTAVMLRAHAKGSHQLCDILREAHHRKCPECQFETNRGASGIELHLKAVHYKIKDLACEFCPFKATYRQKLQKHVNKNHPEAKYLADFMVNREITTEGDKETALEVNAENNNNEVRTEGGDESLEINVDNEEDSTKAGENEVHDEDPVAMVDAEYPEENRGIDESMFYGAVDGLIAQFEQRANRDKARKRGRKSQGGAKRSKRYCNSGNSKSKPSEVVAASTVRQKVDRESNTQTEEEKVAEEEVDKTVTSKNYKTPCYLCPYVADDQDHFTSHILKAHIFGPSEST